MADNIGGTVLGRGGGVRVEVDEVVDAVAIIEVLLVQFGVLDGDT
jgi:hypothetical protein